MRILRFRPPGSVSITQDGLLDFYSGARRAMPVAPRTQGPRSHPPTPPPRRARRPPSRVDRSPCPPLTFARGRRPSPPPPPTQTPNNPREQSRSGSSDCCRRRAVPRVESGPPPLSEHTAPSASLDRPKAQAASTIHTPARQRSSVEPCRALDSSSQTGPELRTSHGQLAGAARARGAPGLARRLEGRPGPLDEPCAAL